MIRTDTKRHVDTNIYERNFNYYFTTYNGYNEDGKKVRKYATWRGNKNKSISWNDKQAKKEYSKFYAKNNKHRYLKQNITFELLVDSYMYMYAKNRLKVNTQAKYKYMIDKFLIERLKDIKLNDMDIIKLNKYVNSMKTTKSNKVLLITILKSIYKYAFNVGYIDVNASTYLHVEKGIQEKKTNKVNSIECLDIEKIEDITKYFDKENTINYLLITLVYTGMRVGEALALTWKDIDLKRNMIDINKTLVYVNGKYFIQEPKTIRSKRKIYVCDEVITVLKKQLEKQDKQKITKESIVFCTKNNTYLNYNNVNKSLKRRLKDTKYSDIHLHTLRHIFTTIMLKNNVDVTKVSRILGHTNTNTTINIYQDILYNDIRKIMKVCE